MIFFISSRKMGLGRSKPHPRVIKVTPLQSQEAEIPSAGPVFYALNRNLEEKSSYPFSRLQGQKQALEGLLPPLRETWYGRHPAVSRPMYLDIPLKNEESSIIKRHPPRRIQKLEPIDLPQVITSERLLSQQEARTRHKAKELEKKMQLPMYTSGKRQYLHKMKMLEINHKRQEAQMKLHSLQSKARLDMQKLKDHNGNKITESMPRSKHYDVVTILPDETVNRHPGNPRDEKFVEYHTENDYCVRKIGKMEAWLREQAAQGPLFCDSSSSDSDEPEKDPKRPQALVRTRTERVPLYDEFYDRE
uniref:Coiled-coil domain containing 198 n=3 Tax=Peromyscus maniculatus bairdii TaxID=230844 RepID=A0A8C8W077_PERMB